MSYYTEKNALAKIWNRDSTRLEWAKWVYHHPEDLEELISIALQETDISTIQDKIDTIEQVDTSQEQKIVALQDTVSKQKMSPISLTKLQQLLATGG